MDDQSNEFPSWDEMDDDSDVEALLEATRQRIASEKFSEEFDFGLDELDEPRVIYLAGPMRGVPRFNADAFDMAEAMLSAHGFDVLNPAQRDREEGLDHALCPWGTEAESEAQGFDLGEALSFDMDFIATKADAVVLLPGWMMSRGAVAELAVAKAVGIDVYEYDDSTCTIKELEVADAKCRSCQGKAATAPLSMRLVMIVQEWSNRTASRIKARILRKAVK